jgi:predicted ATPase
MLSSLTLKNFKCFEKQTFSFRNLTMLTGLNSAGKSTVLQTMLLLRQSHEDRILHSTGLTLDGPLVQLGTAQDVLFEGARDETITFGLGWSDDVAVDFSFSADLASDVLTALHTHEPDIYAQKSLFTDRFQYLEAERLGPRNAFDMSEFEVKRHRQLGTSGEYTAHFMASFGSQRIGHAQMHHPSASGTTLRDETEAWMSEISPGLRLHFKPYSNLDLVNLAVSFSSPKAVSSNEYRTGNVGFGITYALPVVVSLLSSEPGDLVLLENPEAHLHPRAQAKLGELIARACSSGVQVIFETHSDHVLNGVRIAIKSEILSPSDASIYFFNNTSVEGRRQTQVVPITIDQRGRIDHWPDGFFDEFEKSIEQLI